jgi:hypothetical protein
MKIGSKVGHYIRHILSTRQDFLKKLNRAVDSRTPRAQMALEERLTNISLTVFMYCKYTALP